MKKKMWKRSWIAGALLLLLAAKPKPAPAAGEAPKEWHPRKVLVLVVSPDSALRASFEDVIAGELSLRGASAVASHVLFPELPKERGPFAEKVGAEGFDAVTVSRAVGREDKAQWQEGSLSYTPQYLGMDWWGGYWYTFEQVSLPGYLKKETRIRVRTDLWRASGTEGALAWSGASDLVDPMTLPQAAHEIGESLVKALRKGGFI